MNPAESDCTACERPNNADNLVQCDRCDGYQHYSCAEVGDSIADADRSFICKRCAEVDEIITVSSHYTNRSSRRTSRSNRSSARVALHLQHLEKEKYIRLRELEDAEKFQRLRRQVEMDFEQQQFALIEAQLEDDDEDESVKSRVSSRMIRDKTSKWVEVMNQTEGEELQAATTSVRTDSTSSAENLRHTPVVPKIHIVPAATDSTSGSVEPQATTTDDDEPSERGEAALASEAIPTDLPAINNGEPRPEKTTTTTSRRAEISVQQQNSDAARTRTSRQESSRVGNTRGSRLFGSIGLSTKNQVRTSVSKSNVRLQPISEIAQISTPIQASQVSASKRNLGNQAGLIEQCENPMTIGVSQGQPKQNYFSSCIPPTVSFAAQTNSKSNPPIGHNQSINPNVPNVQPPAAYGQYSESNPQFSFQPSGQHQFRDSSRQFFWPSSGQQQFRELNSQRVPASERERYEVSSAVNQPPPGYETFLRKPTCLQSSIPLPSTYTNPDYVMNSTEYAPSRPTVQAMSAPPLGQNPRCAPDRQNSHQQQPQRQRAARPTAEQLAARQVIPKELPAFAGDPQDWPLFLSSFINSTETCGYNDAENLARLQRCLRGHALDSVRSRLLIPESVPHVMETLERLYGRPEIIVHSLMKRMRDIPSPRNDDLKTLIRFGMGVENLVDHMILAQQHQHVNNPMLLQELVDRLSSSLKLQWASFKRHYSLVNLATFNAFMKDLVTMASDVTLLDEMGQLTTGKHEKEKRGKPTKEKLFLHQKPSNVSTSPPTVADSSVPKPCVYCSKTDHRIADCPAFKGLSVDERWKTLREKGLCRICLIPHRSWPCRSKLECRVGDCRMRHHSLLHMRKTDPTTPPVSTPERNVVNQHHHSTTSCALLRYLPVSLFYNGKSVNVFAFLDDGSSSTMVEADIAKQLGASGPREPLCLGWTGDITRTEKDSHHIRVEISGCNKGSKYSLNARTVNQLKLPRQTMNYEEVCRNHPYLRKLPLSSYTDAMPRHIIGVDNVKLISALKSRESKTGELVAAKTRLG